MPGLPALDDDNFHDRDRAKPLDRELRQFWQAIDEEFLKATHLGTLRSWWVMPPLPLKISGLPNGRRSRRPIEVIPVLFCKTTDGWPEALARQGKSNRQSKIQNPKLVSRLIITQRRRLSPLV